MDYDRRISDIVGKEQIKESKWINKGKILKSFLQLCGD